MDINTIKRRVKNSYDSHARRARQAGKSLDYTVANLGDLVRTSLESPYGCLYCGVPLRESNWSCDHMMPIARGGQHSIHNLAILCQSCNLAKGMLTDHEFSLLWVALKQMAPGAAQDTLARLKLGAKRRS